MDCSYKSKLYYNVVIEDGDIKGWVSYYVGSGRMSFVQKETGKTFNVDKGLSFNWMQRCWEYFITFLEDDDFVINQEEFEEK